ncbi:MAG: hypothetical protein ABFC38_05655 [Methanospirillum sp.]
MSDIVPADVAAVDAGVIRAAEDEGDVPAQPAAKSMQEMTMNEKDPYSAEFISE